MIRHSGARHCHVRVRAGDGDAAVEVVGRRRPGRRGAGVSGVGVAGAQAGNGLAGLAERAERLRGRIAAGERPGGGFRLEVSVPLSAP